MKPSSTQRRRLGVGCDDPAGSDFERGEQGRRRPPHHGCGRSRRARSAALDSLRPLQGLDRRLFMTQRTIALAEGIDVDHQPHQRLRHERRIVALAQDLRGKVDTMLARRNAASEHQHHPMPWPAEDRSAGHGPWRQLQKRQNALVRGLARESASCCRSGSLNPPRPCSANRAPVANGVAEHPASAAINRVLNIVATNAIRAASHHAAPCSVPGSAPRPACVPSARAEPLWLWGIIPI